MSRKSIDSPCPTTKQSVDTGMCLALACIIIGFLHGKSAWYAAAAIFLIINMTVPLLFRPASIVLFTVSDFFGIIVSKLILTCIYVLLLTPVGMMRRVIGKDPLCLKNFKQSDQSVFLMKTGNVTQDDFKNPF